MDSERWRVHERQHEAGTGDLDRKSRLVLRIEQCALAASQLPVPLFANWNVAELARTASVLYDKRKHRTTELCVAVAYRLGKLRTTPRARSVPHRSIDIDCDTNTPLLESIDNSPRSRRSPSLPLLDANRIVTVIPSFHTGQDEKFASDAATTAASGLPLSTQHQPALRRSITARFPDVQRQQPHILLSSFKTFSASTSTAAARSNGGTGGSGVGSGATQTVDIHALSFRCIVQPNLVPLILLLLLFLLPLCLLHFSSHW
jgi:hypothetical protein